MSRLAAERKFDGPGGLASGGVRVLLTLSGEKIDALARSIGKRFEWPARGRDWGAADHAGDCRPAVFVEGEVAFRARP